MTFLGITGDTQEAEAAFVGCEPQGELANRPIGVARGIYPGRVVWVHDPTVASYDGNGPWWSDAANDPAAADEMVRNAVRTLTGQASTVDAWGAIFRWFNSTHGRGSEGYQTGEKIAIKINQNNQPGHASNNEINGNPTLILSLLKSLINDAGVPEGMISVYDASRAIGDNIYDKCHGHFPNVHFVDHFGGNGREKAEYVNGAIVYSVDNGALATGLAKVAVDAAYLINLAILKGHGGQGVTFGAKNMYGMTSISNDYTQNAHNNFDPNGGCAARYMTFTDWMAHRDMGEKTLVWLMDAIYPTFGLNGTPNDRWNLAPFNGHWTSSIFASLDGVANESVSVDFFRAEWDNAPDLTYADQYLHEAALADAPPSGTFYDPEGDGIRASSLGVHEHWNNAVDKQYSRNLGSGQGIELVHVGAEGIEVPLCGDQNCDEAEDCSSCEPDCGPCAAGNGGSGAPGGAGGASGGAAAGGTGGIVEGASGAAGNAGSGGSSGRSPPNSPSRVDDWYSEEPSDCACRAAGTNSGKQHGLMVAIASILGILAARRRLYRVQQGLRWRETPDAHVASIDVSRHPKKRNSRTLPSTCLAQPGT